MYVIKNVRSNKYYKGLLNNYSVTVIYTGKIEDARKFYLKHNARCIMTTLCGYAGENFGFEIIELEGDEKIGQTKKKKEVKESDY